MPHMNLWGGLLVLLVAVHCVQGSVLGIDLGSQWYKLSTLKSIGGRMVFDIILNEQSSRKTHTMVGWSKDERAFGSDAFNLQARYPASSYGYLTPLLGKSIDNPFFEEAKEWITFNVVDDPARGSFLLQHDANTTFTPEELVGMILRRAQELATAAGITAHDCVITVPPFLTQHERQAVLDAAHVAGWNVLSLINDVTAFALNYAMERKFENNTQNIVFYDIGATSAKAILATFQSIPDIKKKNKTVTQVLVRSTAWDRSLGGRFLDRNLANHFKKVIKAKYPNFNVDDVKVTLRLLREAQKLKEILSANQIAQAQLVGLGDYDDITLPVTRKEFEDMNGDVVKRTTAVLRSLLAEGNMTKGEIDFVEVVGGTTRVPLIQNTIKEYLGREDLDRHVNGDEGAAIGAALFASTMSPRVRLSSEIRVRDITPYPINVKINLDQESESDSEVVIEEEEGGAAGTALLMRNSRLNTSRSLTFYSYSNFSLDLSYSDPDILPVGSKTDIAHISVTGMPSAHQYNITSKPKVHSSFRITSSGTVVLDKSKVELTISELQKPKPPKVKPILVEEKSTEKKEETTENKEETEEKKEEETADKAEEQNEEEKREENKEEEEVNKEGEEKGEEKGEEQANIPEEGGSEKQEGGEEEEEETESTTETTQEPKWVTKSIKLPLKIASVQTQGVKSFDKDSFQKAERRLSHYDWLDRQRKELEKEKNALEAFIYETRDKLYNDDVIEASTEEEREALGALLSSASEWLDENSESAVTHEYRAQLKPLKEKYEKITFRIKEQRAFPKAAADLQKTIDLTKELLGNITEVLNVTEEERESVLHKVETITAWLGPKQLEQFSLAKSVDPAVTSDELARKQAEIEVLVRPLLRRPKKKKPAPPKKTVIEEETAEGETKETTEEPEQEGEERGEGEIPTTEETTENPAPEETEKKEEKKEEKKKEEKKEEKKGKTETKGKAGEKGKTGKDAKGKETKGSKSEKAGEKGKTGKTGNKDKHPPHDEL